MDDAQVRLVICDIHQHRVEKLLAPGKANVQDVELAFLGQRVQVPPMGLDAIPENPQNPQQGPAYLAQADHQMVRNLAHS